MDRPVNASREAKAGKQTGWGEIITTMKEMMGYKKIEIETSKEMKIGQSKEERIDETLKLQRNEKKPCEMRD